MNIQTFKKLIKSLNGIPWDRQEKAIELAENLTPTEREELANKLQGIHGELEIEIRGQEEYVKQMENLNTLLEKKSAAMKRDMQEEKESSEEYQAIEELLDSST